MQFSIIIPAKNEQANIGRCLDSILQMDWDNGQYEVIVVDNGSTDRTVAIARGKGAQVYQKPECNISGLRNFGASRASGEILAYIDADCTVARDWLRQASAYMFRAEVACFGSPPGVPEGATWVQTAWFLVRRKREPVGETQWLESMNMFVRRDAFRSCGGFDETLFTCEDYDLSLRLKTSGLVVNDSRIVATHHGEAATVRHFFQKELWRGKSNFAGLLQHGLVLSEIPSLAAPALHCLLLLGIAAALALSLKRWSICLLASMVLWQCLLVMKSIQKQWPAPTPARALQLLWLFNVYLVARGVAGLPNWHARIGSRLSA